MKQREVTDRTCVRVAVDPEKLARLREEALGNDHLVALAAFMQAVGNETRLRMLYVLHRAGELCVCDLADIFEISQPAVSRHLKILREKALVEARREAQTIYYRVCTANPFARLLVRLFDELELDRIQLNLNLKEETS
ncbi:regulatory protein ArsR [Rhodothermus marinus SG0.5JP17-172]|jgi:DNA-binding transcriptional ArsR family regulator|uniref:ArsR/SmtB family transcription factor n=1 Tax=Rhodothermus marinus TaxID=29549 RepID=UPI000223D7DB|nr:metalloregulator ArsR/SmtB family transcription factor [Rhodothermus marinus]AEN73369.1 regulatory protein ArsR [Rhodothermus marinus SG0.5JP17-172]MBO2492084.1 ArsR family transcriptional regulator [Rhodothermus marinus]